MDQREDSVSPMRALFGRSSILPSSSPSAPSSFERRTLKSSIGLPTPSSKVVFDCGPYMVLAIEHMIEHYFPSCFKRDPTTEGLVSSPYYDLDVNDHSIILDISTRGVPSTKDNSVLVLPYCTADERTWLYVNCVARNHSGPIILFGLYSIPEEYFLSNWKSKNSRNLQTLKEQIESQFGSEAVPSTSSRKVNFQEVLALSQELGAPWIETHIDDSKGMKKLWEEAAWMIISNTFKPNPISPDPNESTTLFTVAGKPGKAGPTTLNNPRSIMYQSDCIIVSDTDNHAIRKITLDSSNATNQILAGGVAGFQDGPPALAKFNHPTCCCLSLDGSYLIVVDSSNHAIRRIGPFSSPHTPNSLANAEVPQFSFATSSTSSFPSIFSRKTQATINTNSSYDVSTFAGASPDCMVKDDYVNGSYANSRFRKPSFITQWPDKDAYLVADSGNNVIRLLKDGFTSTFAGTGQTVLTDGPALNSTFNNPTSVRVSPLGNIIVSDSGNNCIRKIRSGKVSTLAGCGKVRFLDGPALTARFFQPSDAIELASGEVIIVDKGNCRLRLLYHGIVTTITGHPANTNFEGAATQVALNLPSYIDITREGDILVADSANHRIVYAARPTLRTTSSAEYIKWRRFDYCMLPKNSSIFSPINPIKLQPNDLTIPEVQLLQSFLLSPDSLSSFSKQWLFAGLTPKKNEKEISKWINMANNRFYIRNQSFDPLKGDFGDICRAPGLILASNCLLSSLNTPPFWGVNFSLTLTNYSTLRVEWKLLDQLEESFPDSVFYVFPSSGLLEPTESININVVVNLLSGSEIFHILRFMCTTLNPPITCFTGIAVNVVGQKHSSIMIPQKKDSSGTPPAMDVPCSPLTVTPASVVHSAVSSGYWVIGMKMLGEMSRLGSGAAAAVFKSELFGLPVAVKRWDIGLKDAPPDEFVSELNTLKRFRHPNLIRFLGANSGSGNAWLVTELAVRGSLDSFLKNATAEEKTWSIKLRMAIDAATGLKFLHDNNLIHRDVKSLNFLVNSDLRLRVADFGTTRVASTTLTQGVGSFDWMSPETYSTQRYTNKTDVFSFGLVLYELVCETFPNRSYEQIMKGQINELPLEFQSTHPEFSGLVHACCATDPIARPNFGEILERLKQIQFLGPNFLKHKCRNRSNANASSKPWLERAAYLSKKLSSTNSSNVAPAPVVHSTLAQIPSNLDQMSPQILPNIVSNNTESIGNQAHLAQFPPDGAVNSWGS